MDEVSPLLAIRLFGPFDVRLDGAPLPRLRSQKGQWLLALLVLRHGREVERSWLAGLLWPDSPEPQAFTNLRNSLTDLRRALGPAAERLRAPTPRSLTLDLIGAEVDVVTFDAAMASGDPASLAEAVPLYRGPLLEECGEEWVFQEREARRQACLAALETLEAAARQRADWSAAEECLRRAIAVDPSRETAQRALMQTLADAGDYAAAIHAYRALRLHLNRELNAEPDAETLALFDRLRAAARERAQGRRTTNDERPTTDDRGLATDDRETPVTVGVAGEERSPLVVRRSSFVAAEDTLTFLFTDIAGSTRLWEEDPDAMRLALARHDDLLRQEIEQNGGHVFKTVGDQFCTAFGTAFAALAAALAAQRALHDSGKSLHVRMALHTGAAEVRHGDYFGPALNRVARLLGVAHGGQVLLSGGTAALVQDGLPPGASLRDLGAHRLRDLQRPERIFQLVHADVPGDFPPLASLDAVPHNLPEQVTSFVGREIEMADVRRLMATTRLLTLTGAGGTGKTRLALQIAADLPEHGGDGVWLIELASLVDPELVPQAVATVLHVREERGRALAETLAGQLQSKRLIFILDNCEHLLGACAALAERLLRHCPYLRILATSREALNIPGEIVYRLPSLSLPEEIGVSRQTPGVSNDLQEWRDADPSAWRLTPDDWRLAQSAAVRLFSDRAVAAAPAFAVTSRNASAVAQICRQLDGIPLAIELAAARVRALTPDQIAARLDDRFGLLTRGSRTALPRQQTLRALIDWSYDLLSEPERALLRRLSIFSGGWTLDAAEAVCGCGVSVECEVSSVKRNVIDPEPLTLNTQHSTLRLAEGDVLDLLTSLVDKSLVIYQEAEQRYRLLETTRAYGRERLIAAGEFEALRCGHAEYYVAFTESAAGRLKGPEQSAWFDAVEAAHDNLRAVLEWSLGALPSAAGSAGRAETPADGRRELGLRLAGALGHFWWARGYWTEGRRWLKGLLDGPVARTMLRAAALAAAAQLASSQHDRAALRPLLEESLAIYEEIGDAAGVAQVLSMLGWAVLRDGHPAEARPLYERSLALRRTLGDLAGMASSLNNLGVVAAEQGDHATARRYYQQCLAIQRQLGNEEGVAWTFLSLAESTQAEGDWEATRDYFTESLTRFHTVGHRKAIDSCLRGLASVAIGPWLPPPPTTQDSTTNDQRPTTNAPSPGDAHALQQAARRAAYLCGAAQALRIAIEESDETIRYIAADAEVVALRAALGEASFSAALAQGRAMTLDQAVEYALKGEGNVKCKVSN